MFYLLIEALPKQADSEQIGGAFINCWIESGAPEEAEQIARKVIEAQGWKVLSFQDVFQVDRSFYQENPEGREYFEQALIDNEVFVFHSYPNSEVADNADDA